MLVWVFEKRIIRDFQTSKSDTCNNLDNEFVSNYFDTNVNTISNNDNSSNNSSNNSDRVFDDDKDSTTSVTVNNNNTETAKIVSDKDSITDDNQYDEAPIVAKDFNLEIKTYRQMKLKSH